MGDQTHNENPTDCDRSTNRRQVADGRVDTAAAAIRAAVDDRHHHQSTDRTEHDGVTERLSGPPLTEPPLPPPGRVGGGLQPPGGQEGDHSCPRHTAAAHVTETRPAADVSRQQPCQLGSAHRPVVRASRAGTGRPAGACHRVTTAHRQHWGNSSAQN